MVHKFFLILIIESDNLSIDHVVNIHDHLLSCLWFHFVNHNFYHTKFQNIEILMPCYICCKLWRSLNNKHPCDRCKYMWYDPVCKHYYKSWLLCCLLIKNSTIIDSGLFSPNQNGLVIYAKNLIESMLIKMIEMIEVLIDMVTLFFFKILYINSVSLSVSVSVCRGPETQITFNKTVPSNLRAQKLFRTSSSYFLLLLLRPFPRSNCRRQWGRYFWDLEGGWGDLGALFLG
jgi:hypothetical protein